MLWNVSCLDTRCFRVVQDLLLPFPVCLLNSESSRLSLPVPSWGGFMAERLSLLRNCSSFFLPKALLQLNEFIQTIPRKTPACVQWCSCPCALGGAEFWVGSSELHDKVIFGSCSAWGLEEPLSLLPTKRGQAPEEPPSSF